MAKKPTITTIASGYASNTQLNNNFTALRDGFNNTLSLDGSTPNAMNADLDMNSNDILNAGEVDVQGLKIDGIQVYPGTTQIATTYATQNYTGNGSTVTYAMGYNPAIKSNVDVYIDGVYQNQDAFGISGTNLIFTAAPPLNSAIEIKVPVNVTSLTNTDSSQLVYTQGGTGSVTRTVQSRLRDFVSVKDFGAVGDGVTDDTAAIQAALDYGYTSGQTVIGVSGDTYKVSSTINMNGSSDFGGCTFIVDAAFASEVIKSSASVAGVTLLRELRITYPSITNNRTAGVATTAGSVGIMIEGCRNCAFYVNNIYGFETGLLLYSNDNATYTAYNQFYFNSLIAGNKTNLHFKTESTGWVNECTFIGGQFAQFSTDAAAFNITNLKIEKVDLGGNNPPNGHTFVGCSMEGNFNRTIEYAINNASSYFSCNTWLNCRFEAAVTFEFDAKALFDSFYNCFAFGQASFVNDVIPNNFSTRMARYTNDSAPTGGASGFRADQEVVRFIASNSASAIALGVGSNTHTHGGLAGTGAYQLFNAFNTALEYPVAEINVVGGVPKIAFGAGTAAPAVELRASGTQLRTVTSIFLPNDDDVTDLGASSNRWANIYAGNGTIITSDVRAKQDIADFDDAEKRVAAALKRLVKKFRFKNAVEKKGDAARTHIGVIAQEVEDAFAAEGLNAFDYGILCHDTWDAEPEVKDEDGNVISAGHAAGDRYAVRYEQLLAFIIAAI